MAMARPVVSVSLRFSARLLRFRYTLVGSKIIPFRVRVAIRVGVRVRLIHFLLSANSFFGRAFIANRRVASKELNVWEMDT